MCGKGKKNVFLTWDRQEHVALPAILFGRTSTKGVSKKLTVYLEEGSVSDCKGWENRCPPGSMQYVNCTIAGIKKA